MGFNNTPGTDATNNPNYTQADGTLPSGITLPAGATGLIGTVGAILKNILFFQLIDAAGTNKASVSQSGSLKVNAGCFPQHKIAKSSPAAGYVMITGANNFGKIWNASANDQNSLIDLYDSASATPSGDPFMAGIQFTGGQILEFDTQLTTGLVVVVRNAALNTDGGIISTNELI
jgi:hypothetical protein